MTDAWDQRCLGVILSRFFNEATLEEDYRFCPDSDLYRPSKSFERLADYLDYVDTLPLLDPTDIFNMHPNANLIFLVSFVLCL